MGRHRGLGADRVRRLPPVEQLGLEKVLSHEPEMGIALMGLPDDGVEAVRAHGAVRAVHRDAGLRGERLGPLLERERLAVHEHRGTADDLDVLEAHAVQVLLGELTSHADGRAAVEHLRDELPDRRLHRLQTVRVVVEVRLCADPQDDDGDPQLLDQLRHPLQGALERRTERVRQRHDEDVELLVYAVGRRRVRTDAVGEDLGPRRRQKLVSRVTEDQIARVRREDISVEGLFERGHIEGALA